MVDIEGILAHDYDYGIGYNGRLPWSVPSDLNLFVKYTKFKTLIVGRKTFESFPQVMQKGNYGRNFIVLSTSNQKDTGCVKYVKDLSTLDKIISENFDTQYIVVGGSQIYELMIPYISCLYISKIRKETNANIYLPQKVKDMILPQNGQFYSVFEKVFEEFDFKKLLRFIECANCNTAVKVHENPQFCTQKNNEFVLSCPNCGKNVVAPTYFSALREFRGLIE